MRRTAIGMTLLYGLFIVTWATADEKDKIAEAIKPPKQGIAWMSPTKGHNVYGLVTFTETGGETVIQGKVTGLEPGKHGVHIHEFGDLRGEKGLSVGDHFNPTNAKHGSPDDAEHHLGDLGNIEANKDGVAVIDMRVKKLKVHYITGRALVIHAKADDFKAQPSGEAGDRVSVGVIGIANEKLGSLKDK